MSPKKNPWIEAMRLRTLPVSVAGVIMAMGLATIYDSFQIVPAVLCLMVATLAQIASNFANEYYDFRDGLDKQGRQGPRRGVTEGDISPQAMLRATYITLACACAIGCSLIYYGGWWMLPAGIAIAIGAIAYSAGPYPLSRHGLGEVAVITFFGIAPVCLTFFIQAHFCPWLVVLASIGVGLMGANVLIINNYRDADADADVGKRTLAVILGRPTMRHIYLINGIVAVILMYKLWWEMPWYILILPMLYIIILWMIWRAMRSRSGHSLTPLLGATATAMLFYCTTFAIAAAFIS